MLFWLDPKSALRDIRRNERGRELRVGSCLKLDGSTTWRTLILREAKRARKRSEEHYGQGSFAFNRKILLCSVRFIPLLTALQSNWGS